MPPSIPEEDLPVPDPDGNPIHPTELAVAENRMLNDMHGPATSAAELQGDREAARAEADRQHTAPMSEDEAAAYRLAPENLLDWLEDRTTVADVQTLERWDNHLDWMEPGGRQPAEVFAEPDLLEQKRER